MKEGLLQIVSKDELEVFIAESRKLASTRNYTVKNKTVFNKVMNAVRMYPDAVKKLPIIWGLRSRVQMAVRIVNSVNNNKSATLGNMMRF